MLRQRVITVLWSLPLVTIAAWFGEPWFTIVVAVWGLLAAFELYRIVATKVPPLTSLGLIWTLLFILSPHLDYYLVTPLLLTSAVVLSLIWLVLRRQQEQEGAVE